MFEQRARTSSGVTGLSLVLLLALPTAASAGGDPTRPPASLLAPPAAADAEEAAPEQVSEARLTSILHGPDSRARIDGHWLRAGESHKDIHVLRIERDRVRIEEGGERRTLTLKRALTVKKPSGDGNHP